MCCDHFLHLKGVFGRRRSAHVTDAPAEVCSSPLLNQTVITDAHLLHARADRRQRPEVPSARPIDAELLDV